MLPSPCVRHRLSLPVHWPLRLLDWIPTPQIARSTAQPTATPSTVRFARDGLTLLELVIALGILAVLSSVALQSIEPLADQARYETTQRVMQDLKRATIGDPKARGVDGQRVLFGYTADTGFLPSQLDDLLSRPAGLIAFASQSFDSDRDTTNDVTLASGWNGPYFQLGVGQSSIVDGWGNTPLVDPDGGTFNYLSRGSDNDSTAPESGYRADLSADIYAQEYTNSLTFRLFDIDGTTGLRIDPAPTGTQQLGVLFYAPNANGGTTSAVEEQMLIVASSGTFEATRSSVALGATAARGILWDDVDSDDVLDSGETIVKKSYVHYVNVVPSNSIRVEMELQ